MPRSIASPPVAVTSARRPGPFASGMPAGPSSWPGARTSSPVARTATRGRRCTSTASTPAPATRVTAAAVSATPARMSSVPAARSLPASRTDPRRSTGSWTRAATGTGPVASRPRGPGRRSASSGVVASTGTTASAPSGNRAPVAIRAAVPEVTVTSGAAPAAMSPTTRSSTGCSSPAAAVSAATMA